MSDEKKVLKPCPFCGVVPRLVETLEDHFAIACNNPDGCDMQVYTLNYADGNGERAIEIWNTRKGDTPN